MCSPTCLPLLIITMEELRMAENIITTTFNSCNSNSKTKVRLFGTMATKVHNSVSLFGTMHIATEVQQRGDLRGSGLTTQSAIQHRAAA